MFIVAIFVLSGCAKDSASSAETSVADQETAAETANEEDTENNANSNTEDNTNADTEMNADSDIEMTPLNTKEPPKGDTIVTLEEIPFEIVAAKDIYGDDGVFFRYMNKSKYIISAVEISYEDKENEGFVGVTGAYSTTLPGEKPTNENPIFDLSSIDNFVPTILHATVYDKENQKYVDVGYDYKLNEYYMADPIVIEYDSDTAPILIDEFEVNYDSPEPNEDGELSNIQFKNNSSAEIYEFVITFLNEANGRVHFVKNINPIGPGEELIMDALGSGEYKDGEKITPLGYRYTVVDDEKELVVEYDLKLELYDVDEYKYED